MIPRALSEDRSVSQPWLWVTAVVAVAFAFRLVPVMRGGGLYGLDSYDDGVYYASAIGLIHGLLPYQDFLLLHPPGITLLLAPFAAAAQLIGDSNGFAAARVAWMLLGAANAALIWKILRPIGLVAAVFGAFGYAVFHPGVYADHSTLLESPATTALLIAILLLQPLVNSESLPRGKAFAAGALLGLAMTIKIWGAVTLLVVLGWLLLLRRLRAALQVAIAGAATATGVCLPFLLAAPTAMWNQIVRDQFFRRRTLGDTIFDRLQSTVGLGIVERSLPAITLAAVAALLGAAALAWSYREARLPVLLMLGQGAVLLTTPFWLSHFAAFTAATVALTAGAGTGRLIALIRAGPLRIAVGAVLAAVLVGYASGWRTVIFGGPFPNEFRAITDAAPGCVTSDDPAALVLTDSLSRNLRRGCQLIADVGGNSHDLAAASGRRVSRNRNEAFQHFALDYLRTGSVTILLRYSGDQGFNMKTTAVLEQWPLLARSGLFEVRQPVEPGRSEGTK